jgi:hypothetical protein
MPSDNDLPEGPAESWHRTRWLPVLAALSIPLLAFLITGGWYYRHFSNVIDARLREGAFRDSVNVYGAPVVFNQGDALTAGDIEAELHLAGYQPASHGSPRSFAESRDGLIATPPAGSNDSPVRIVVIAGGGIQRLEANGRQIKTWTAGYPLIENLSPGNEKRHMVTFEELPPVLIDAGQGAVLSTSAAG